MVQQQSTASPIPEHVAIIMDGNGRWAQRNDKSRIEGHRQGVENVRKIVECARDLCIPCITLYAFSVENWKRPKPEVSALMHLLDIYLKKELRDLMKNGVRLNVIGRIEDLPPKVQKNLLDTVEKTALNTRQILSLALNYGARTELLDAVRAYTGLVAAGRANPDELDWETFSDCLYTHDLPDPDLIIRTSGEHRLSNFLLMQGAYAEIYFTPLCWPEFLPEHFRKAIQNYQGRERRYGRTGEQVQAPSQTPLPA